MKLFGSSISLTNPFILGAGAVLLAPLVMPVVAGVLKPVLKGSIKGGLLAYEKIKVTAAEAVEAVEDLAAEAKAEIAAGEERAAPKAKKAAGKAA
jgi:hypothetical protein